MDWTYLTLAGAAIWFGILLLPWRPWDTREVLEAGVLPGEENLSDITALIPARNEAEFVACFTGGIGGPG